MYEEYSGNGFACTRAERNDLQQALSDSHLFISHGISQLTEQNIIEFSKDFCLVRGIG